MRRATLCLLTLCTATAAAQTPITPGDTVEGRLGEGDAHLTTGELCDVYVFEAEAGQMLSLRHESEAFDCYLLFIDPTGYQQDNDDFGGELHSQIDITARATGVCRAVATTYSPGASGEYTFSVRVGSVSVSPESD